MIIIYFIYNNVWPNYFLFEQHIVCHLITSADKEYECIMLLQFEYSRVFPINEMITELYRKNAYEKNIDLIFYWVLLLSCLKDDT